MADIELVTDRLILRRERPGDRDEWRSHINTPEVTAHFGGPASHEAIEASFDRMAEAGELPFLLVERRAHRMLIGKCGLSRIATPSAPSAITGEVQMGWTIRADSWGQGYAKEAAETIMAWAFDNLDCDRLFAQTSERNRRSWGLMQRLGLTRLPDLDYPDPDYPSEENPTIVFAISRHSWSARGG